MDNSLSASALTYVQRFATLGRSAATGLVSIPAGSQHVVYEMVDQLHQKAGALIQEEWHQARRCIRSLSGGS